jgi:hypothetical protein
MSDLDAPFICAACGRPLLGDPEDDPAGESGLPLCGECDRARNFDALLEAESLEESTLDGEGGWD